jgi:hypothetical protein
MDGDTVERYREDLLIDVIAEKLGFGRLAGILPGDIEPAYIFVATGILLDFGVVDTYNYVIADKNTVVQDPLALIVPVGFVLAVVGIHWMRDSYADAVSSLRVAEQEDEEEAFAEQFEEIVPFRAKLWGWGIGVLLIALNLFALIGISTVIEIEGVLGAFVSNAIISPLIAVPLIIEFAMLYVGIHILVPRRIANADLDLFFYDPRKMGGFAKVGDLLKRSYYLYTIGLLLYFFLIYGPIIFDSIIQTPYPEPTAVIAVMFTGLWLLGVISIAYSMYRIHMVMSAKKEQRIEEIEDELRGLLEDPYDINSDNLADHDKLDEIQHRLEQVRSTREYPSTFTMWTQIGISVILPQILNVAMQVTSL